VGDEVRAVLSGEFDRVIELGFDVHRGKALSYFDIISLWSEPFFLPAGSW
jgi:hypothetical protein